MRNCIIHIIFLFIIIVKCLHSCCIRSQFNILQCIKLRPYLKLGGRKWKVRWILSVALSLYVDFVWLFCIVCRLIKELFQDARERQGRSVRCHSFLHLLIHSSIHISIHFIYSSIHPILHSFLCSIMCWTCIFTGQLINLLIHFLINHSH